MEKINATATINSISLVALVLLSTERIAIGKKELASQLDLLLELARKLPYSNKTVLPAEDGLSLIKQAKALGTIFEVDNPLGKIITTDEQTAVLLTYYRNNILHTFIIYSLVASCFINNQKMARSSVVKRCVSIFPFIKQELFIHFKEDQLSEYIERILEQFCQLGLLDKNENQVHRPDESSEEFEQLMCIAQMVKPTLLRYGILLNLVTSKIGQAKVSRRELEAQSQQIAQRLAALFSLNAPESFDKNLFKTTISVLRKAKLIQTNKDNSFDIDPKVEKLNTQVLDNVNVGTKLIMQKTAKWAKSYWDDNAANNKK